MNPIEDINLNEIVINAANKLLDERREKLSHQVKSIFARIDALHQEIRKHENELNKKRGQLTEALNKIKKLKDGDWSALKEEDKKDSKENSET